jgi:hypothetical protein
VSPNNEQERQDTKQEWQDSDRKRQFNEKTGWNNSEKKKCLTFNTLISIFHSFFYPFPFLQITSYWQKKQRHINFADISAKKKKVNDCDGCNIKLNPDSNYTGVPHWCSG